MADDEQTPDTPDTPESPQAPEATNEAAAVAPEVPAAQPEQPAEAPQSPEAQPEQPVAEQPAEAPTEIASNPEQAMEIAGVAEDAPLEAIEEAQRAAEQPSAAEPAPTEAVAEQPPVSEPEEEDEPAPRVKPSVPGAHLEVDIVPEGADPLGRTTPDDPYAIEEEDEPRAQSEDEQGEDFVEPISSAAIDLASGARYRATGKRKTAIARVTLRPGSGSYLVNGRPLEEHFPRLTLQRNIRQPLETVGFQDQMDVVARLHGGGISAQAGALRHGVSRALLEADPNLRGELKRRGFLTRDSRAKERKKAGLKKARKRPQFSKR